MFKKGGGASGDKGTLTPLQAVCSALHNAPVEEIEWRIRFPQESCPEMWVSLR